MQGETWHGFPWAHTCKNHSDIIFLISVGGRHRQNILTTAPDLAGQARWEDNHEYSRYENYPEFSRRCKCTSIIFQGTRQHWFRGWSFQDRPDLLLASNHWEVTMQLKKQSRTEKKDGKINLNYFSSPSFLSESTTLGIRVPEILELIPHQVDAKN